MAYDGEQRGHAELIDEIIYGDLRKGALEDKRGVFFSSTTKADILDIEENGVAILSRDLNDNDFERKLEEDDQDHRGYRVRLIFLDQINKDPMKLPITSELFELLFKTYNVNPHFADYLARQRMPGSATHSHSGEAHIYRSEGWYSAVVRSHELYSGKMHDLSQIAIDWQRFCVWSDYVEIDGSAAQTFIILRCPLKVKARLLDIIETPDQRSAFRSHPMLLHCFFAEQLVMHSYDFLEYFSERMYAVENEVKRLTVTRDAPPHDYTSCSHDFLTLDKQIHQVATDYDIAKEMVVALQARSAFFKSLLPAGENDRTAAQNRIDAVLHNLRNEVNLTKTYSDLYLSRSQIGVSEISDLMSKRDAEINLQMATESTMISRAAHRDNRSLRIIQILSIIFLPASFVTSIFGMGFFSAQQGDDGQTTFVASTRWWLYFVVAVPFTALTLIIIGAHQRWEVNKMKKDGLLEDIENLQALKSGLKKDQ